MKKSRFVAFDCNFNFITWAVLVLTLKMFLLSLRLFMSYFYTYELN